MIRTLILILFAALLLPTAAPAEEHGEGGPLHEAMQAANKGYKTIRRAARSGDLATNDVKAAVEALITHMTEAKQHEPPMIATLPADHQQAAREDYAKRMDALLVDLTALKAALAAGDAEQAKAVADKLGGHKKDGHDTYIPEEE